MITTIILSLVIVALLIDRVVAAERTHKREIDIRNIYDKRIDKLENKLLANSLVDYTTNQHYEEHGPQSVVDPNDLVAAFAKVEGQKPPDDDEFDGLDVT